MNTEPYSRMELEQAAEEILAELDGWERSVRQKQRPEERADAEQLVRLMMAAAEQAAVRLQNGRKAADAGTDVHTQSGTESVGKTEIGTHAPGQPEMQTEAGSMPLWEQIQVPQPVSAGAAIPVPQWTPFGSGQQLDTISDWIERDSRRYDSKFTIF